MLHLAVVLATTVGVAGAVISPAGAHAHRSRQPAPPTYVPPVDAPVADPFRPPAGPYAPGNRGLEYDTSPGQPARASADGTVTFAGPVGGALHVTVAHSDGVRTSYSFLATVAVVRGQRLQQGDQVGTTGERLHFGARAGDAYIDPAALFGGTVTEVQLLPFEVPPGHTPGADARALAQIALAEPGPSTADLASTLDWLRERARSGLTYARQLDPVGRGLDVAGDLADRLLFPAPCSVAPAPRRPVSGQRRVAVTVAGLGSSSASAAIDDLRLGELGYPPDRAVRFSYAGGRTPATGGAFTGIDAHAYATGDTQGDVRVAARRLADLVEDVAAADPAADVDVFAHSLGGLVARLALVELDRRGFDLERLGVVATLGTPHEGADLATAVTAANARVVPGLALEVAAQVLDLGLDPDAAVVGQLAEGSDVVAALAADGVPPGVRLVSIGARGDLVVPVPRTAVQGGVQVTVPIGGIDAHSALVGSTAATDELARALAGQHPACEAWDDVVADVLTGHAVSAIEDHVGAAAVYGLG